MPSTSPCTHTFFSHQDEHFLGNLPAFFLDKSLMGNRWHWLSWPPALSGGRGRAPALHCPASRPKTWLLTPTRPLTCSLTLDKSCYGNLCSVIPCKVMWVIPQALVPPGAKSLLFKSLIHIHVTILPATVYSLRAMPLFILSEPCRYVGDIP